MNETPEFKVNRMFNANRELVWKTWTEPELLAHWYGPGVETIIHKFDLKPGGLWLNEMKFGENSDFSKMEFIEIDTNEKLVFHHHSTDNQWNTGPNPMMPNWPQTFLTIVTFENQGSQTRLQLSQKPINASEEEMASFAEFMANMEKGWGSGFDLIDEILERLAG